MNHIQKYKTQAKKSDILGPNKYIKGLTDADYVLLGPARIKELYRSLLLIEHRRFNGPLHIAEENEYFERIEGTLFYSRMGTHIAARNLWVTFKRIIKRGFLAKLLKK